jgi:AcrR family transcriptional regulator
MTSHATGLREKKRHETRARLENATISLATRNGLDEVTVEMISEKANVSTRTFFNYFDSKEDALLGFYHCNHPEDSATGPASSTDTTSLVEFVVDILVNALSPSIMDPTLNKSRIKLMRQYPQLLDKQIAHITSKKESLADLIKKRILARKTAAICDNDAALQSEVIIMACVGGVKAAAKEWAGTKQNDISLDKIKQRAVMLVQESIRTIQC